MSGLFLFVGVHGYFTMNFLSFALDVLVRECGVIDAFGEVSRVKYCGALAICYLLAADSVAVHSHDAHFAVSCVLRQDYLDYIALRHHSHIALALNYQSYAVKVVQVK